MSFFSALNPLPWFKRYFWKLLLVLAVLVGAYLLFLDATIVQRFSGDKWQVPAQIFARSLELQERQEIFLSEIEEELVLLGYRKVSKASSTGEYQLSGNHLIVYRRGFAFPSGYEAPVAVEIQESKGRIEKIKRLSDGIALANFKLEPWLVTRFVNGDGEDRMLLDINQVPATLIDALTLVEDRDFYSHHGVAPLSIVRALVANIEAGKTVQGGSTLTQQLVKNMFLTRDKRLVRKINEAFMALIIELRYDKQTILQAYLNEVFLGQNGNIGVHGFGLASYFYFDRPVTELNVSEMAMLVGMVKGPSYYNPRRFPERARQRRDRVLRILFEQGYFDRNDFEVAINQPLNIASGASLVKGKHPAFMDQVQRELKEILVTPRFLATNRGIATKQPASATNDVLDNVSQSGLKIFTTLDPLAQRKAEASLQHRLTAIEQSRQMDGLQGALVISNIDKGEIRALVGSRQVDYHGFNRALDARRPIGSLIKPAVYLTALEQAANYNLATPLQDQPITLKSSQGRQWQPQNADKTFRGQVPLLSALTQSLNVPTVNLGMEVGLDNVAETLQRLGVDRAIREVPALTLGSLDLTPLEVNQMYQTLANNGRRIELHSITAVLNAENEPVWGANTMPSYAFDKEPVYLINYALHKVTLEGTAKAIRQAFPEINMAGKTGTTDDYRDSWFSGFDKNILITSWIGRDDNSQMGLTGSSGALTVFIDYQQRQRPKSLVRRFPQGLGIAHFDPDSGHAVPAGCPDAISVPAILEALPRNMEDCQSEVLPPPKKPSFWERIFGD